MSDTKHTPGPWVVSSSVMGEDAITHTGKTGDDSRHICTLPMLSRYSATGEEYKANAKLIAAAPELLTQLEIMTALCRIKYGNLDKDVYAQIEKSETLIKKLNPTL